ncbi:MAG TPA: MBL fold metallo-hydrolase [Candidatus Binataceae bacterium]|nr:MBL fold metallo-hydrolase [Candidatus Binataceae bacterium]
MSDKPRTFVPMLRFLGAAGTVTGSRFLLTTDASCALVDCGLFQGLKELRLRNWDKFPVRPAGIDAVMLTHAHLDHSGYIPGLCRDGFRGRVLATPTTQALARIVLPDSGHLQEEEAQYANRRGYSKHTPARPLYTEEDALDALKHFSAVAFEQTIEVAPRISATFRFAGHILGASSILVEIDQRKKRRVLFSGDLGRPRHPILHAPSPVPDADVIVVESTYGDRRHDDDESLKNFEQAIVRTAERGGVIIVPSFAVDRTEVVLHYIRKAAQQGRIPQLPIYVDSPMALAALAIYTGSIAQRSAEIRSDVSAADLDPGNLTQVRSVDESIALNALHGPMIIISASGMATGGRVLHHLANRLPDPRNTVILVGYQADGTRGRSLLNGDKTIKMLGRYIAVRAEIVNVPAFSVHADQAELIGWLRTAPHAPSTCYVVHGEPAAATALRDEIRHQLGWNAVVPRHLEAVRID